MKGILRGLAFLAVYFVATVAAHVITAVMNATLGRLGAIIANICALLMAWVIWWWLGRLKAFKQAKKHSADVQRGLDILRQEEI